jgi:5-methylcytosine-specific restriction endonuclease McrA
MSRKAKQLWLDHGNILPPCINTGCDRFVAIRHWTASGDPSIKSECSRCATARKEKRIIEGIQFQKKEYCENYDGHLGFGCAVKQQEYSNLPSDVYHLDHIDGDHFNNVPDNIETLCSICHARKGKESGDFNSQKASSRVKKESQYEF